MTTLSWLPEAACAGGLRPCPARWRAERVARVGGGGRREDGEENEELHVCWGLLGLLLGALEAVYG